MKKDKVDYINPFEIGEEHIDKSEIINKLKEICSIHFKFANERNGQKLTVEDIKQICKNNNFMITDDELLQIVEQ